MILEALGLAMPAVTCASPLVTFINCIALKLSHPCCVTLGDFPKNHLRTILLE